MGLFDVLRDRSKTALDAQLAAKTQQLAEVTLKLRRLSKWSAEYASAQHERAMLVDRLHALEKQRHGDAYAERHRLAREKQSL